MAPAARAAEDPADQEEQPDEEQREQEEPGEEAVVSLVHHVDDLDVLAVLLCDLYLLDALGDAVALARVVRADRDADPSQEHHQQRNHSDPSTHVDLLVSRLPPRWRRDVKRS